MGKFNDLIKTDPELAAGVLKDAGLHLVNTYIPDIYLTKEEYDICMDLILAGKAKDPSKDAPTANPPKDEEGSGDGTKDPEGDNTDIPGGGDTEDTPTE